MDLRFLNCIERVPVLIVPNSQYYLRNLRLVSAITVAMKTSAQSADFDSVSIVPSIIIAWTTLPTTITAARVL